MASLLDVIGRTIEHPHAVGQHRLVESSELYVNDRLIITYRIERGSVSLTRY
jgi:hypothetical protein